MGYTFRVIIYHKQYKNGLSNLYFYQRKSISSLHGSIIDPEKKFKIKLGGLLAQFPILDSAIYSNHFHKI
jgi:hypothetical protein